MTRRKRETSEEEKTLFRETFHDARPHLPPAAKKSAEKGEKTKADKKPPPRARPAHTGCRRADIRTACAADSSNRNRVSICMG